MKFVRRIAALLAAALGTYVIAVVANSQFVMNAHNVPISFSERLNMTAFDVSNMWLYLVIILVALLLGFLVAALVKRFLPWPFTICVPRRWRRCNRHDSRVDVSDVPDRTDQRRTLGDGFSLAGPWQAG